MTTLLQQTTSKLDKAYQAALGLPMGSVERRRMFQALNGLDDQLDKLREACFEKGMDFTKEPAL